MATVIGTNNSETLNADDGVTNSNDTILGLDGADMIFGLGGNDKLKGGGGADMLNGGSGIDTAYYNDSEEAVNVRLYSGEAEGGTAEGDTLISIENVYGSAYNDIITGSSVNNVLSGYDGDDSLFGGGGNDTIDGGDGWDTASFGLDAQDLVVNLVTGIATSTSGTDTLINIEEAHGSGYWDILIGNDGDNRLAAGAGWDELYGGGGNDFLWGGAGHDILDGGSGSDTIFYGSDYGSDYPGPVTVNLATGTASGPDADGDTLISIENVVGSGSNDSLTGDNGINMLDGGHGNDTLKGGGGADTLYGEWGNDFLVGGTGDDTMYGSINDDTYSVDSQGDVVIEYDYFLNGVNIGGIDTVATGVNYTLAAGQSIEILKTAVPTGTSPISLTGNERANTIYGNAGANVIDGGGGADTMIGGLGDDDYYVNVAGDAVTESGGQGIDEVFTSVSWTLTAGADVETLRTTSDSGTAAIDLTGNTTGNNLIGNNGANILNGGAGDDTLTGLGGADSFRFDTPLDIMFNVDVITDFNVADDTIVLENTIFNAFSAGPLADERFIYGTTPLQANDNILYDVGTGALYYDSDGNGAAASAVLFAWVTPGTALTYQDFIVS